MNLKELTLSNHKRAERSKFVHRMLKREMTPYQYYVYMTNQLYSYYALEYHAEIMGLFLGIEEIKRSTLIAKDLHELEDDHGFKQQNALKSTKKYVDYVGTIARDPKRLMSHIYVRHMGDLSGGQIIKKYVPGSGQHYDFDGDVSELKEKIRTKLDDSMADEANKCFDLIYEFFEELENSFDMGTADKTAK